MVHRRGDRFLERFGRSTGPSSHAVADRPADRHSFQPCLSPDGSLLAAIVTDEEGYPCAMQRPLGPGGQGGAGRERRVRLPVKGPVRRVAYSEDGRWLACEMAPDGGEREQIWLVSTRPEDPSAHTPYRFTDATVRVVCWDGDRLAVTAIDDDGVAEGRLVTHWTGECEVVDRRMGGELVHVRDAVALFRVGSRGNRELIRIDPGGHWRPLMPPDPGSTTDDGVVIDSGRADGHFRALVRSDHGGTRPRLLDVRMTPHSSQITTLAERPDADLDSVEVSRDGRVAALLWNHDGLSQIELLDLSLSPPQALASPVLPTAVAHTPSLTADGGLLAITVEGAELPPRVAIWNVRDAQWAGQEPGNGVLAGIAAPIGDPGPLAHEPRAFGPATPVTLSDTGDPTFVPELIRYPARDGLELSAWLYRSAESEPGPALVYLHGGPEGQSRPGYHDIIRRLVASGYTVVAPNVRGSSGFGRAFSHADERYSRFAGIDDVADTVEHVVSMGVADPARMVVAGRSYGGYLTMATLVRHPTLWRGGIAVCGMSDMETFYRTTEPWIAIAAFPKYGHPLQERELLREMSPIHRLHEVQVPVLFIHGANDSNVPPSESEQAAAILRERGVPTDVLIFEDEGHEFVKRANRTVMGDRAVAFCREVLG